MKTSCLLLFVFIQFVLIDLNAINIDSLYNDYLANKSSSFTRIENTKITFKSLLIDYIVKKEQVNFKGDSAQNKVFYYKYYQNTFVYGGISNYFKEESLDLFYFFDIKEETCLFIFKGLTNECNNQYNYIIYKDYKPKLILRTLNDKVSSIVNVTETKGKYYLQNLHPNTINLDKLDYQSFIMILNQINCNTFEKYLKEPINKRDIPVLNFF